MDGASASAGGIEAMLAEARRRHADGDLDAAAVLYARILAREPACADALHLSGLVHLRRGDLGAAGEAIARALDHRPGWARAHANLGAVRMAEGRAAQALECFERALAIDAADPDTLFNRALALHALERLDDAVEGYRLALRKAPGLTEAALNLGGALRALGRLEESERAFADVVSQRPDFAEAHFNLALARKELGRIDDAIDGFARALELRDNFLEARFNLANALRTARRFADSATAFRDVLARDPDSARAWYGLGSALHDAGELGAAIDALGEALVRSPRDRDTLHALGMTRLQCADAAGALDAFDAALALYPGSARELADRAVALHMLGRGDEAARLVDFDRLLDARRLDAVPGHLDVASFNRALAAHVVTHPTLMDSPDGFATRHGSHSLELLDRDAEPVTGLRAVIEGRVAEYLAAHPYDASHPFLAAHPRRWRLTAWAVVMRERGHQIAHTHPSAWLSGVYYVELPDEVDERDSGQAGWIEFGRPDPMYPIESTPPLRVLCPAPGLMVLFPSYFYHRTVPLTRPGRRISVAFDVVALDSASRRRGSHGARAWEGGSG